MWRNRAGIGSTIVFLVVLFVSPLVGAMDIYVTRLDDTNNLCAIDGCSLREAIKLANGNSEHDTIHLPAGKIELTLLGTGEDGNNNGDLDIWTDMVIVGEGPGTSIVDANHRDRVFHITDSSVTVIFKMMKITGGGHLTMGDGGAGVLAEGATVVFQHCDIWDNHCLESNVGGAGVKVINGGTLWLTKSSVRGNTSSGFGTVYVGGAPDAQLYVDNSTISGNTAFDGSGFMFIGSIADVRESTISSNTDTAPFFGTISVTSGHLTMRYSTVAGDPAPTIKTHLAGSQVTLERTIIAGQCDATYGGPFITEYGNMECPGNTCNLDPDGDLRFVTLPFLGPLGKHGGPTETHRPWQDSPAVDHVFSISLPGCPRPDQRGISRPQDGTNGIGTPCDIGAVELIYSELFLDGFECGYTGAWSDTTQ